METHKRSLAKTISWRIIATTITILISYMWLGEWTSSIALALTANGIKAVLYYMHERGWNLLSWGLVVSTKSVEKD